MEGLNTMENTYLYEVTYIDRFGKQTYDQIRATSKEEAQKAMQKAIIVKRIVSVSRIGN